MGTARRIGVGAGRAVLLVSQPQRYTRWMRRGSRARAGAQDGTTRLFNTAASGSIACSEHLSQTSHTSAAKQSWLCWRKAGDYYSSNLTSLAPVQCCFHRTKALVQNTIFFLEATRATLTAVSCKFHRGAQHQAALDIITRKLAEPVATSGQLQCKAGAQLQLPRASQPANWLVEPLVSQRPHMTPFCFLPTPSLP